MDLFEEKSNNGGVSMLMKWGFRAPLRGCSLFRHGATKQVPLRQRRFVPHVEAQTPRRDRFLTILSSFQVQFTEVNLK